MSKPSRTTPPAGDAESLADLPYEEALRRLESVVQAMEADDLPLEGLLARYEEGVKLVDICQTRLAAAEVRLEQLERTAAGTLSLKPLAAPTDPGATATSDVDHYSDSNGSPQ